MKLYFLYWDLESYRLNSPRQQCSCTCSVHNTIDYVMTSDFRGKKLGGCHSLVGAHPSVIFSELATPFDNRRQADVPLVS